MPEYKTVNLRKEVNQQFEEYIQDKPFESVKQFLIHCAAKEMERDQKYEAALDALVKLSEEKNLTQKDIEELLD